MVLYWVQVTQSCLQHCINIKHGSGGSLPSDLRGPQSSSMPKKWPNPLSTFPGCTAARPCSRVWVQMSQSRLTYCINAKGMTTGSIPSDLWGAQRSFAFSVKALFPSAWLRIPPKPFSVKIAIAQCPIERKSWIGWRFENRINQNHKPNYPKMTLNAIRPNLPHIC